MARDLEAITLNYWKVGNAVRHPDAPSMSCEKAFKLLRASDKLRPTDWRLSDLMHVIQFDIVEGNDEWRDKRRVAGSVSTLRTKD